MILNNLTLKSILTHLKVTTKNFETINLLVTIVPTIPSIKDFLILPHTVKPLKIIYIFLPTTTIPSILTHCSTSTSTFLKMYQSILRNIDYIIFDTQSFKTIPKTIITYLKSKNITYLSLPYQTFTSVFHKIVSTHLLHVNYAHINVPVCKVISTTKKIFKNITYLVNHIYYTLTHYPLVSVSYAIKNIFIKTTHSKLFKLS